MKTRSKLLDRILDLDIEWWTGVFSAIASMEELPNGNEEKSNIREYH